MKRGVTPLFIALLLPALGFADGTWHVGLGMGASYADKLKFDGDPRRVEFDLGKPNWSVNVGRTVGDNWRLGLEYAVQENAPEVLYGGTGPDLDPSTDDVLKTNTFMVNAFRDFRVGSAFMPYLGIGLGAAEVEFEFSQAIFDLPSIPVIDDSQWRVGLQAMAGLSIPFSDRLGFGVEYRYLYVPDVELADVSGEPVDFSHGAQSIWLSMNYRTRALPDRPRELPPARGLYVGASLGAAWPIDEQNGDETFDAFSLGPSASASLGLALTRWWRVELDVGRRKNSLDLVDFGFFLGETRTRGDVSATHAMVNSIFRLRPNAAITPIVGLGVGIAEVDYDVRFAESGESYLEDSDTGAALQFILGFDIAISERLVVSTDYRLWAAKVKVERADGVEIKPRHATHTMGVALRYSFSG